MHLRLAEREGTMLELDWKRREERRIIGDEPSNYRKYPASSVVTSLDFQISIGRQAICLSTLL